MVRCSRELEPGFEALLHGRYLDARHAEPRVDKHRVQLVVREASHVRGVAQTLEPVTLHARLCVRNHVNHHHASARPHDARHLRNGRTWIGDVVQREPRDNDVEGALPKWQRPCGPLDKGHIGMVLCLGKPPTLGQHCRGSIQAGHRGRVLRERPSAGARPRRHLKNVLIPAKLQDLNKMSQVVHAREVP